MNKINIKNKQNLKKGLSSEQKDFVDIVNESNILTCNSKGIASCIFTSLENTKFCEIKNKLFRYLTLEEMVEIQDCSAEFSLPVSKLEYKTLSLLQTLKSTSNTSINLITKGIRKIHKQVVERTSKIIVKSIHKPFVSQNMYVNQALLNYSKNKDLFVSLKHMNNKKLQVFLKQRDLELVNYDSFSDDSDTKKFVLFPYAGGKQGVNKTAMQSLIEDAFKKKQYTKFIDIFAGGMGATYNVLPILLQNSIEEVVINDINKSIINVYRQIQKKPKQVQRHLASISLDYYKKHGKFKPDSREEARALHISIEKEFKELEIQKKMSPRRAALFLFLMHKSTGAMLDYDMQTKTCFFETSYKIINIELLINKVALYHQILISTKITFKSVQYQTLLKKYKNSSDALLLIDPPYIEYSEKESNSSSSFTYGINFNHKELLNKMKNIEADFIYYNNHNPLIENFATRHSYRYSKNSRTYANGILERTVAIEICMSKLPKRSNQTSFNKQFDETLLVA